MDRKTSARRFAVLYVPEASARLLEGLRPELRHRLFVVPAPEASDRIGETGLAAASCGIRTGQSLAEARRHHPDLLEIELPEAFLSKAREELRTLLESFAPIVEELALGEWLLDLTGCERLVGGRWEDWRHRLQEALRKRIGITAPIAIAATRTAARLLARGPEGEACPVGEESERLSPLPLAVLPDLSESLRIKLSRLELRTLGDLSRLPRRYLVRRFGAAGEQLCAQARGLDLLPTTSFHKTPAPLALCEELELFAPSCEETVPVAPSRHRSSRAWKGRAAA